MECVNTTVLFLPVHSSSLHYCYSRFSYCTIDPSIVDETFVQTVMLHGLIVFIYYSCLITDPSLTLTNLTSLMELDPDDYEMTDYLDVPDNVWDDIERHHSNKSKFTEVM